jgi:hypothetical protein
VIAPRHRLTSGIRVAIRDPKDEPLVLCLQDF